MGLQVAALIELMRCSSYPFIVYMDSDVYLRRSPMHFAQIIDEHMRISPTDTEETLPLIVVSSDRAGDVNATGATNTGVMILRNHPRTLKLLLEWYHAPLINRARFSDLHSWPFDQGSFNWLVLPQYRDNVRIIPMLVWNSPEGEIARHLWGGMTDHTTIGFRRIEMLTNVLRGMLAEAIQPCIESRVVEPKRRTE
jgi:hypothetical protein